MIIIISSKTPSLNSNYPTSEQYGSMANAVLIAFPAILKNREVEGHELQLQWKLRIQRKSQNPRRQVSSVIELMLKQREHLLAAAEVDGPLIYGVKAYLPSRPDSEDDESLDRHRQWLPLVPDSEDDESLDRHKQWLPLVWSRRNSRNDKICDTCKVNVVLFCYLRYQYVIFNCILPFVNHYSLTR